MVSGSSAVVSVVTRSHGCFYLSLGVEEPASLPVATDYPHHQLTRDESVRRCFNSFFYFISVALSTRRPLTFQPKQRDAAIDPPLFPTMLLLLCYRLYVIFLPLYPYVELGPSLKVHYDGQHRSGQRSCRFPFTVSQLIGTNHSRRPDFFKSNRGEKIVKNKTMPSMWW